MDAREVEARLISDLFLRTYRGDYQWLPYLFRSLNRHASGWRKLIVVVPVGQEADFPVLPELDAPEFCEAVEFATCPVYANDYIGQQITKLRAWELSDADAIGYLDSDMVFTRPFDARALPTSGMGAHPDGVGARPWSEAGEAKDAWYESTRDLLGFEPTHETMCRHPFVYRRETIQGCYEHVVGEDGLLEYGRCFSEFNLLGNYAIHNGAATYTPAGPELQRQFRSYDGLTVDTLQWLAVNGYDSHVPAEKLDGQGGIWTIAADSTVSRWDRETGRLDHDQNALPRILDAFRGRPVVWDVGALIGDHSRSYADAGHRVVAIEPQPMAFECLARNFAGNDRVTCLHLAAGASEQVTLASPDEQNAGARFLTQVAGGHETVLLDDLTRVYSAPDAIKLDVEGWEVKALRGASAILASVRPVMVIEVNRGALVRAGDSPEALHELLTWCGYRMRDLYTNEPWLAGDTREQFDIVAKPIRHVGGNGSKPKLRILHNLARSGGTIVSRCLACMDGVALLSEVHPTFWQGWNDPVLQARKWYGVHVPDDLDFVDTIAALEEAFRARGQMLVLRSWDFVDFIPSSKNRKPAGRSQLTESLRERFELVESALLRGATEAHASVERFLGERVDQAAFVEGAWAFSSQPWSAVDYEVLCHDPQVFMAELCRQLDLPLDPAWATKWQSYVNVTGDVANQLERVHIGRKETPHAE